jgi:DNA adenine methylase
MRNFFRYPGGKTKLVSPITKKLQKYISPNTEYRECFFGGGGIGLKFLTDNPSIKNIWINDKDIGIASLWTCVIKHPDELIERVQRFIPTIEAFYSVKNELIAETPGSTVDLGFKKLAIHQLSYSGLGTKSGGPLGGAQQKSQYKIDCRWSPDYISTKIKNLHAELKHYNIHGGECSNLDFGDMIRDTSSESLLYLDPPYFVKGNELYQHSFALADHVRLSEMLRETKHKWVLSYDDCPEIRAMYEWAHIENLDVTYTINNKKTTDEKEKSSVKGELLIESK